MSEPSDKACLENANPVQDLLTIPRPSSMDLFSIRRSFSATNILSSISRRLFTPPISPNITAVHIESPPVTPRPRPLDSPAHIQPLSDTECLSSVNHGDKMNAVDKLKLMWTEKEAKVVLDYLLHYPTPSALKDQVIHAMASLLAYESQCLEKGKDFLSLETALTNIVKDWTNSNEADNENTEQSSFWRCLQILVLLYVFKSFIVYVMLTIYRRFAWMRQKFGLSTAWIYTNHFPADTPLKKSLERLSHLSTSFSYVTTDRLVISLLTLTLSWGSYFARTIGHDPGAADYYALCASKLKLSEAEKHESVNTSAESSSVDPIEQLSQFHGQLLALLLTSTAIPVNASAQDTLFTKSLLVTINAYVKQLEASPDVSPGSFCYKHCLLGLAQTLVPKATRSVTRRSMLMDKKMPEKDDDWYLSGSDVDILPEANITEKAKPLDSECLSMEADAEDTDVVSQKIDAAIDSTETASPNKNSRDVWGKKHVNIAASIF